MQALAQRNGFSVSGLEAARARARLALAAPAGAAAPPSEASPPAAARRVSVAVAVEPLPEEERANLAHLEALCARFEEGGGGGDDDVAGRSARVANAHRVAVRDCYAVKDFLKHELHYQWDPATLAWWTHLDATALQQLRQLAQRQGFELCGMATAEAAARRVLAGGAGAAPGGGAAGGSPARPSAAAADDVETPSPARPQRRRRGSNDDEAAAGPARRERRSPAREQPYARAPAPPRCELHGVPCVLRKAGAGAMPHNRGRRFWCCPRATAETEGECLWQWEDGSKPFSEQSQARFDAWAARQGGGCTWCAAFGCCCD